MRRTIVCLDLCSTTFKFSVMPKKKQPGKPSEIPLPEKHPEIKPPVDPEEPLSTPEEDPEIIPEEEPVEPPPYEVPPPGERP